MNYTESIQRLKEKYSNDVEALDEIRRAEETINYYMQQGQPEKATAHIKQLEAFLHDWY